MMASIDIVIVNWNSGRQLLECLNSIENFRGTMVNRVVVVDNGSNDGSENFIEELPRVTLIRARENLGFAKACNLGSKECTSEYLLFLNPDARLYPDSLSRVLDFMSNEQSNGIGICGIQLIDEAGNIARSCARFHTLGTSLAHAVGLDRIFPRLGHMMTEWDHLSTREVDHVIGAFYLIRRSVFLVLNGFDEYFFMYQEDIDLSRRAKILGWSTIYLADARAFHAGGGTSRQVKATRLFYSLRSRVQYTHKHFNGIEFVSVLIAMLTLEPFARLLLAACQFSASSIKETLTAYSMLYHWLPIGIYRKSLH